MAKSDLSRAAIVERAFDVADAEGLDAVTIRRLAQDLGVTPMALYWHVKNKDELLDAMGDAIYESVSWRSPDTDGWETRLKAVLRGLVEAMRRHPSCAELAFRRVLAGDAGRDISEFTFGLLRTAGFSPRRTADIAIHALHTAVMLVDGEPGAEHETPAEHDVKIAEKQSVLDQLPVDRYPYLVEMSFEMLHCDDTDDYYEFGIDLFVAGVRATLELAGV